MHSYDEARLRARVMAALARLRGVLDATKNPTLAEDVPHRYDDKFALAETLTRIACAATLQDLRQLGLGPEPFKRVHAWAKDSAVFLRLHAEERCSFVREDVREVASDQKLVVEKRGLFGKEETRASVVTTVREYVWRLELGYELYVQRGNDGERFPILLRKSELELKTPAKTSPRPEHVLRPTREVALTWLLRELDDEGTASFAIDRTAATCHTPRRNRATDEAFGFFVELAAFVGHVDEHFTREIFPIAPPHAVALEQLAPDGVFVPVLPLFDAREGESPDLEASAALAAPMLAEHARTLAHRIAELGRILPERGVATLSEATLLVCLLHARAVAEAYADAVQYLESMLEKQLRSAIGKEITPGDFRAFMRFHEQRLFAPAFRPAPFSHAVRRPEHAPEGALSLELGEGKERRPIATICTSRVATRPMFLPIDAATRIPFTGERHLHAWVAHGFADSPKLPLELIARARQFSSFVLVLGRIASADVFEPSHALIVENKDLLEVPLLLETIPTPKEFRDAVQSLSPEQREFAKAFRQMQLESTLFGIAIVQIKPQLERLLRLPQGGLTKEIQLTQDLMSLFLDYQIPSDLITYEGPGDAPPEDKVARVKGHVQRMLDVIAASKTRELEEARERERYRLAEADRSPVGGFGPPAMAFAAGPPGGPPPMPMAMPAPPSPGGMPPAPQPRAMPTSATRAKSAPSMKRSTRPEMALEAMPVAEAGASTGSTQPRTTESRPPQHAQVRDADAASSGEGPIDYTAIPALLDRRFDAIDEDSALRPTILEVGDSFRRTSQKSLLAEPTTDTLRGDALDKERHRALDLLDALSRSGTLQIEDASLHVVIASTHRFDRTLLATLIERSTNPIEKVERSLLIIATTIHGLPAEALLAEHERARVLGNTPHLATKAEGEPGPGGEG